MLQLSGDITSAASLRMWQVQVVLLAMSPLVLGTGGGMGQSDPGMPSGEEPDDDFESVTCQTTSLCAAVFGNASCKNIQDDVELSGESTCPNASLCICVDSSNISNISEDESVLPVNETTIIPCNSNLKCSHRNAVCLAIYSAHGKVTDINLLSNEQSCPLDAEECICVNDMTPTTPTVAPATPGGAGGGASDLKTTTLTTTASPVLCTQGLPSAFNVDVTDCEGRYDGQTCNVSCTGAFRGPSATYSCIPGEGRFIGRGPVCEELKCHDDLPVGPYDSTSCAAKAVDEWCQLTCLPGYMGGPAVYVCGKDGLFSTEQNLTCERRMCSEETMPSGSGVTSDCAGKRADDTCTAKCRPEFAENATNFSCGKDGDFKGIAPTCALLPCDIPQRLQTALFKHNCADMLHGDDCSAWCATGYTGDVTMQSCQFGNLTGNDPACTPDQCTTNMPGGFGVNTSDCDGKRTDESCTLTCKLGYQATPASSHCTCQSTGAFSDCSMTCSRVPCLNVSSAGSSFRNASLAHDCDGVVFGQSCSVFCGPGYSISGNAIVLSCTATGAFAGLEAPTCVANECKYNIPRGLGVTHDCNGKATGQSCTANVMLGYEFPDGKAKTLQCEANKVFQGNVPKTRLSRCPDPVIEGADSSCNVKEMGTNCWAYCGDRMKSYKCDDVGDKIAIIPKNGALNCSRLRRLENDGACDASSAAAVTPPLTAVDIKHNCNGTASGGKCVVECNTGYTGDARLYTCQMGTFNGSGLPTCTAKPCNYSAPDGIGVTSNCAGVSTDSKCIATCGMGYNYASSSGPQNFTCGPHGQFSGTNPSCEASPCIPLSLLPQFETKLCQGKVTEEPCYVGCSDGWTIIDYPALYTCQTDGQFERSGALPNCQPKKCTENIPADAELNASACSGLTTLSNCSVTCANGYEGEPATYTCLPSGAFQGTRPNCTAQVCPNSVSAIQGVTNNCDNIAFGSSCILDCKRGYKIKEGTQVPQWTCAWNPNKGSVELLGNSPQCEGIPCVDNIPQGETFRHTCNVTIDNSCNVSCAPGYTGSATQLTCQANRAMSGEPPSCVAQTCAAVSPAPQIAFTCDPLVSYRSSCPARCAEGYRLVGGMTDYLCDIHGNDGLSVSLRGTEPKCEALPCQYQKPAGTQYSHDCQDLVTGKDCIVSCADHYAGTPQSFSCLANRSFIGTLPVCVKVDFTRTASTTSATETRTTSATMITTTVTTIPDTVIRGIIKMRVSNPAEFVKNPNVSAAVASGIATALNLPTTWVNVTLSVVSGRMLLGGNGSGPVSSGGNGSGPVDSGEIQVDYIITIPGDTPLIGARSPSNVTTALGAADPAYFQAKISSAITQNGAGTFDIEVQTISYEVISGPAEVLPTTTTVVPATTTAAPASASRGVPPQEDEDDHSMRRVIVVVAIFVAVGFFTVLICCCIALCCCTACFSKRRNVGQQERLQPVQPVHPVDLDGNGVQELHVMPVQGAPRPGVWATPVGNPRLAAEQPGLPGVVEP